MKSSAFLARVYGLEAAATSPNTLDRLSSAVEAEIISKDSCDTISEAYRFLLRLRLREQIKMIAEGKQPTNVFPLSELSSTERSRLRDTFRAIEVWQERAAHRYRTGYF